MGAPIPWLAMAAAVTLVNGGTLRYLARREGSTASLFWSWAWLAWAASIAPMLLLGARPQFSPMFLVVGLLWAVSALAFLRGSHALVGRPMPRSWYGIAVVSACIALLLVLQHHGTLAMAPLALFQGAGLSASGLVVLRRARGQAGAWLYGSALTLLGLHVLDAPLVMRFPSLVPWGFAFALSLEVGAGLGMVLLHYEQAGARLLVAERSLEQSRRAEALGRIAGGVAHDFNNMLTILQGHAELVRSEASSSSTLTEASRGIDEVVERGSRLTRQLLTFGRRAETHLTPLDVRDAVERTLEWLAKLVPKPITLEFRCREGSYHAVLDRSLLEQITLNLVTNARDAIDGPGNISVELESRDSPTPTIVMRVIDSGAGMEAAVLSRIFEPFFTTKGSERGTGLGLASVEGAVAQLGGAISVESRPGQGTRFEVVLPRRS
ncbi:MAG TPA: ATP-binding protein [Polyangiaceae bacterium]|nr:ATP-binding protein [Polyangiaceae bacterium]